MSGGVPEREFDGFSRGLVFDGGDIVFEDGGDVFLFDHSKMKISHDVLSSRNHRGRKRPLKVFSLVVGGRCCLPQESIPGYN